MFICTSYSRILLGFFILIICIHDILVLADDQDNVNQDDDRSVHLLRRGVWARLFRAETNLPSTIHGVVPKFPAVLRQARIQFIPYDKRTIPIELRKALYAHGIVGRR